MRHRLLLAGLAALALAACQRTEQQLAAGGGGGGRGRYVGLGHYEPGRLWRETVHPAGATSAGEKRARPGDDDEILIVLDSATGEVRQCGNLSGACVGMNPWSRPLADQEGAPAALSRNDADLDAGAAGH